MKCVCMKDDDGGRKVEEGKQGDEKRQKTKVKACGMV